VSDRFNRKQYQRLEEGDRAPDVPAGSLRVWRDNQGRSFVAAQDTRERKPMTLQLQDTAALEPHRPNGNYLGSFATADIPSAEARFIGYWLIDSTTETAKFCLPSGGGYAWS